MLENNKQAFEGEFYKFSKKLYKDEGIDFDADFQQMMDDIWSYIELSRKIAKQEGRKIEKEMQRRFK